MHGRVCKLQPCFVRFVHTLYRNTEYHVRMYIQHCTVQLQRIYRSNLVGRSITLTIAYHKKHAKCLCDSPHVLCIIITPYYPYCYYCVLQLPARR